MNVNELIRQYEAMLHEKRSARFSEEEYEDIIAFYAEKGKYHEALKATRLALQEYPFSTEFYFLDLPM